MNEDMTEAPRTRGGHKRRWLVPGIGAAAAAALLGGTAFAQQPSPSAATPGPQAEQSQTQDQAQDEQQEPSLNGSVTAPAEAPGAPEQDDAAEAQQLAKLPGLISDTDAISAATADGGTADTATLEEEDGSVVYEVDVTKPDGTIAEVIVDAGNGTVLATEADDNEADEGPEGNEANKGSGAGNGPSANPAG